MKTIKKECIKCGDEKSIKHFQRHSKELKSCNECYYKNKEIINECFKMANKLFEQKVEIGIMG